LFLQLAYTYGQSSSLFSDDSVVQQSYSTLARLLYEWVTADV